jgi:CheY-like chemotaxis protein
MKILIVEDDADMRDLLRLILERSYYVPILASHGKEGVEKAISEKPKLILMDIRMPIMDGWEATRAIRANPDTKNIPFLATTVLFRPHEITACLEAGCNAYMVRPFNSRSSGQNQTNGNRSYPRSIGPRVTTRTSFGFDGASGEILSTTSDSAF